MGSRIRVSALVGMIVWLLGGAPALAANCGGALPCQCGDMVTVDYTMTADLGPCLGHGLQLQRNVTLDCQGFRIVGLGNGSEQYGVYLRGDTGAELTGVTVRNCDVSGFLRGIRLRAANDNIVEDNYTHHNGDVTAHVGYGIEVTVGSKNNLLQRNMVEANADEGIHLSSGTGPNQLVDNVIFNNYLEQIYVLSSHGNSLIGNTSYGTGSNSLYLKDANDNYLEGNTFKDRTARVTGAASGNVFIDNTFVNATLQFRAYDATPNRIPTNNSVAGGSLTHTGTCLRFTRTWANTVSDLSLACATEVLSEGTAAEPSSNTIVSVALNPSKMSVDAYSTLAVGWWLDVHVQEQNGAPIPGARVQALDAAGTGVFDLTTDATGDIPSQMLLQYVRTGASTTTKTPHAINTSKAGYEPDSRVVQAVQDVNVTVSLAPPGGSTPGPASFSDNFNRPDSTTLGNGWMEVQGDLTVSGSELKNVAAKGMHLAVLPALSGATQSAAADFAPVDASPNPRFGVILRFQDPRNYYLVYRLAGGTSALRISRIVNGVERVLAQRALLNPTRNQFFRLVGRVAGTTLTLELDGIPKLSVSDSTFASGSLGILLGPNLAPTVHRADNFSASAQ